MPTACRSAGPLGRRAGRHRRGLCQAARRSTPPTATRRSAGRCSPSWRWGCSAARPTVGQASPIGRRTPMRLAASLRARARRLRLSLHAARAGAGRRSLPRPRTAASLPRRAPPVTILVSIDGFRPDYLDRGVTPGLSRLAAEGVTAPMRPSFPSKTFPNHWTLVTGLRPDRHGIVANTMEDPARPGETFTMATDDPVLVERRRADLGDRGEGGHPHRDDVLAGLERRAGAAMRATDWHDDVDRRHAAERLAAVRRRR